MTTFKNTIINDTTYIQPPRGTTIQRPTIYTNIIKWTNTGSQSYSVLSGVTPTLTNTSWTCPTGVTQVEVLVVAGGGGGGSQHGGGGGAGGVIYSSALSVTPTTVYTVTVGAGGAGGATGGNAGTNGSNSVFSSLTAIGGGGGGGWANGPAGASSVGRVGGSGGGGCLIAVGGAGTDGQGFAGGTAFGGAGGANSAINGYPNGGAGGGGAGGVGTSLNYGMYISGAGGPGLCFNITGTNIWYGGGGSGGSHSPSKPAGVTLGGGGAGGLGNDASPTGDGWPGTAGTGGGGGGSGASGSVGGAGGSGVVIIRYVVASDNTEPRGLLRYNTDLNDIEVYENSYAGWVGQEPTKNHGGHNLIKYSDQLETSPPNTAANGATFHWTQFGSSIQTTAVQPPVIVNSPVTWNVLDQGTDQLSKDNNLTAFSNNSGWYYQRATVGVTSGKWYWESTTTVTSGTYYVMAGIASYSSPTNNGHMGANAANVYSYGYASNTGNKHNNGSSVAYGASFQTINDVVGVAFDADNGTLTFYKNGVSQGTAYTGITGQGPYYPAVSCYASTTYTNFGATPFRYGPPAGYSPWDQARSVTKLRSPASGNGYGLVNINWNSNVAFTVGKTYTFSIFAKAAEWTRLGIRLYDGSVAYFIRTTVNLSTGTLISANEAGTTTIIPYGNGWYKVSVTGVCTASGTGTISVEAHNTAIVQTEETSNGGGIYIYGAQFEEGTGSEDLVITKSQASPIPTVLNGYKTHTFTGVGTSGFTPSVTGLVEVLVVGGGGGGGANHAAGGGAGGVLYRSDYQVVSGQQYVVTVGAGGAVGPGYSTTQGINGTNSVFGTLVAAGGGGGGNRRDAGTTGIEYGLWGGSGGGGGGQGADNTPNIWGGAGTLGQGNKGGNGAFHGGGGGGGAGGPGGSVNASDGALASTTRPGNGGQGMYFSQFAHVGGYPAGWFGGGGAGNAHSAGLTNPATPGWGGGGWPQDQVASGESVNGRANTGGGGGGSTGSGASGGGAGGSGIVIVRYKN